MDFFTRLIPVVLMTWSSLPPEALATHAHRNAAQFVARRRVEAWFEHERVLGRIVTHDTEILARVYLGGLYNQAMWDDTMGDHDPSPLDRDSFARGFVDTLWRGIRPLEVDNGL